MLEREELKVFLILLLVFSILAVASTLTAIILSVLWGYLGFTMNITSVSYMCSIYLTFKMQNNLTLIYNVIFIESLISLIFQLIAVITLIYLTVKHCKSNDSYFSQLTQFIIRLLYLYFSVGLLGLCISVGYYGTFIIEEGIYCLYNIYSDWKILGGLFTAALLFLLICWFILLFFWNHKKHKFGGISPQSITQKSSEVQQPVNMIGLFQTMKQIIKKQTLIEQRQNKQPLLQDLDEEGQEDDHYFEVNEKQKLQYITFEEYNRSMGQKMYKQYQNQQIIKELMKQQDEKMQKKQHQRILTQMQVQRTKKQDFGDVALSPDDPNFNKIFQELQIKEENQTSRPLIVSEAKEQLYFPANFVPRNQKENEAFQNYKQKLLQKFRRYVPVKNDSILSSVIQSDKNPRYKHPQNIEGGRSKKVMNKYFKDYKRPSRDEQLYLKTFDPRHNSDKNNLDFDNFDKINEESFESATFNEIKDPPVKQKPLQKDKNIPISKPVKIPKQTQSQVLYFQKQKIKTLSRKKLFDTESQIKKLTAQSFSSILTALVKGVEQTTFKNKLKQLRDLRNEGKEGSPTNRAVKRKEKLIQSIRSKFA